MLLGIGVRYGTVRYGTVSRLDRVATDLVVRLLVLTTVENLPELLF
jgi:hypothetical protein